MPRPVILDNECREQLRLMKSVRNYMKVRFDALKKKLKGKQYDPDDLPDFRELEFVKAWTDYCLRYQHMLGAVKQIMVEKRNQQLASEEFDHLMELTIRELGFVREDEIESLGYVRMLSDGGGEEGMETGTEPGTMSPNGTRETETPISTDRHSQSPSAHPTQDPRSPSATSHRPAPSSTDSSDLSPVPKSPSPIPAQGSAAPRPQDEEAFIWRGTLRRGKKP